MPNKDRSLTERIGKTFDAVLRAFGLRTKTKDTDGFDTLAFDGIQWEIPEHPERVVAIGDIHGDLHALLSILDESAIIDAEGNWVAERTHLVLMGDLIGGKEESRLLLNFLIRLEQQAKRASGFVHALLGNHDLLPIQGELSRMSRAERKLFKKYPVPGAPSLRGKDAFRGNSVYARWARNRNAIIKIGDILFVHAGLDRWALEAEPGRINATVRAWIRHWQGVGPKPPKSTRWTVGVPEMERGSKFENGPLWMRSFKVKFDGDDPIEKKPKEGPSEKQMEKILEHLRVRTIVVGHAPVEGGEVLLSHPYYGEKVVMVDTRLSDKKRGGLGALEIRAGELQPSTPRERRESRLCWNGNGRFWKRATHLRAFG